MSRSRECTERFRVEHKFSFPGLEPGDYESAYPEIEITYKFYPATPAYTPRGEYGPIDPPDPPEVEFISATLIDGDGLTPNEDQVEELARDFLDSDEGFRAACNSAEFCS
jgi:hypothetical protein